MTDKLVPVCTCWDLAEAMAIRGSLEARGVPVHVDGEHQRGMLNLFGSAIELRIMVPASQLRLAHQLASEIIAGLPEPDLGPEEAPAGFELSPTRRPPAEDLVPYPDTEDEDGGDAAAADKEGSEEGEDNEEDARAELEPAQRKSIGAVLMLAFLGLSLGTVHAYAGNKTGARILLAFAALGLLLRLSGSLIGTSILALVWLTDVVHGTVLIVRHNRAVAERKEAEQALEEAEQALEAEALALEDTEEQVAPSS
ncbi:hypothetical protein G6O69_34125 [Pseudenhygromyxa sp. WMMC2535]|uniref:hypothetical protein n=1 Tax=Pseudenhygromyxa sp. WMMC2535 TaxID=2712867 RepID=UPI001557F531|nr:hypothetical protein [Pseudenhygromyxa sp. WMMC2535]NVB42909.1 hypothetical protein [Pseudenhygromyxa sp. WMMC2535]